MILEVNGVALSYGADIVLSNVTFQVNENERVSVVGHNGCGKTTLLNIITGELEPTGGFVALKNGATMGYLKQTSGLVPGNTVLREMKSVNDADKLLARMKELEATMAGDDTLVQEYEAVSARYEAIDGYNLDFNIRRILAGMSFDADSYEKQVSVLSGGEKTRLALAKLLIMSPDLLILDEPTNHLDIDTMEWLEDFLRSYKGAVLVVSHDRHFLDNVTTKTLEIQNGKSKMYNGNFSAYLMQKEQAETREADVHKRTVAEAEKLRDYAQRNLVRASTTKMAQSRLKKLEKLDLTAPESSAHIRVQFRIEPAGEPYKEVVIAEGLAVSAGDKELIRDLDLVLRRGEHLAIIGANGTGKTTLLKTLLGKHRPDGGRLRLGGGVKLSYLEQNLFGVRAKNPLEYIWDLYPSMNQLEIRNLLASVGFRGDDVFISAAGLSGGELARLNLARISLEHPNLLILDEPTNHLDIYTKDIMYEALRDYEGTMIVVTHDRYLIETLDCRILLLNGTTGEFFESYKQYRAAKDGQPQTEKNEPKERRTQPLPDKPLSQKELRQQRAQERERKIFLEQRIEELEEDVAYFEEELAKPEVASDHEKLAELCDMLDDAREELSELTDEWLENHAE